MSDVLPKTTYKRHTLNLDVIFRAAVQDDLPNLEWQGEYTHFRRVFAYTYREQEAGRRLMLLADVNGYPIGQIFMVFGDKMSMLVRRTVRGYLYSLRVMHPFRGQGIGTQLILLAEEQMIQRGMLKSSIAVAKNNPKAKILYMRLGYTICGQDDGDWSYTNHRGELVRVHEPCWILEKPLSQAH